MINGAIQSRSDGIFKKLITLAFAVFFITAGCVHEEVQKAPEAADKSKVLEPVEIREYEGRRLSPADSFPENSIKGPQYIDIEDYRLKITGLVEAPRNYTYDEVTGRQAYSKVVTLNCVEGWSHTVLWEGILLGDLLAESKPEPEAKVVIFHAHDGYSSSLPLDYIVDNYIIMAHRMNNVTMPPERGFPFQLVAESKWGYKWVKWITEIELSDDVNYKGYWESAGYSNTGNLNESF